MIALGIVQVPATREARVMAGLKWAPDIRPNPHAVTNKAIPNEKATPRIALQYIVQKSECYTMVGLE